VYVDREVGLWASFAYQFDQLLTIIEPFFTDTIKLCFLTYRLRILKSNLDWFHVGHAFRYRILTALS
jgi:hypothetical protein